MRGAYWKRLRNIVGSVPGGENKMYQVKNVLLFLDERVHRNPYHSMKKTSGIFFKKKVSFKSLSQEYENSCQNHIHVA